MKTLSSVTVYPSNAVLFDVEGNSYNLDLDGTKGEFTKEEWKEDDIISMFDEEGQDKILDELEMHGYFEQTDLREVAEREALEYIETTDQRNGYPSHIKGAIIGFKTFEQAQELADKEDLLITVFHSRDGWDLWYRTMNSVCEAFTNSCEDYGDNYSDFDKMSESDFMESELLPVIADCSSFEEIEKIIEDKKRLFEEIESMEDGQVVITYCGTYYETIDKTSMSYSNDTKNYAIGLMERFD